MGGQYRTKPHKTTHTHLQRKMTRATKSLCVACNVRPQSARTHRSRPFRQAPCTSRQSAAASCTQPLLTKTASRPAPWLEDLERLPVPTHTKRWAALAKTSFAPAIPSHANLRVVYTAASLPAKVVYWAARGRALSDAHKLIGAERAYDDYRNMGVAVRTTVQRNKQRMHQLVFTLATPCAYVARQRGKSHAQQWCRHVHFVDASQPSTNELYTLAIFPCTLLDQHTRGEYTCEPMHTRVKRAHATSMYVSRAQLVAATRSALPVHQRAVGVCAIAEQGGVKRLQAHDLVLPWTMSEDAMANTLRKQVPSRHTPLVVYCANPTCKAAQVVIEKLAHVGYCNVYYCKEGMGIPKGRGTKSTRKKLH